MCTVSIVPRDAGFRLVCNRDERLDRADAERPRVRRLAENAALWPGDPASGGTWIGVNDRGLAAAVLNRHGARRVDRGAAPHSRGTIVPRLLAAGELASLVAEAALLAPADYEPFMLLAVQGHALAVITSTASEMTLSIGDLLRPVVFTSSSLGDRLVERPRRALFAHIVEHSAAPLAAQARYHRHRWRDWPEISVLMSRPGAATVSRTTIDVFAGTVAMRYEAITDDSRLCTHFRNAHFRRPDLHCGGPARLPW
jgi:hypothetical protein